MRLCFSFPILSPGSSQILVMIILAVYGLFQGALIGGGVVALENLLPNFTLPLKTLFSAMIGLLISVSCAQFIKPPIYSPHPVLFAVVGTITGCLLFFMVSNADKYIGL